MAQKVLIVDDDLYIRDLYKEILSDESFDVEVAIDGQDGLDKMALTKYDLVLLDLMMPKIDGLGVLRELRQNSSKYQQAPIIVVTNLASDPVLGEALGLGAQSYMIKSFINPDQFLQKVHTVLG